MDDADQRRDYGAELGAMGFGGAEEDAAGGSDRAVQWALSAPPATATDDELRARAAIVNQRLTGRMDPFGRMYSGAEHRELGAREYYGKMMGFVESMDPDTLWTDEAREYRALKTDKERRDFAASHMKRRIRDMGEDAFDAALAPVEGLSEDYLLSSLQSVSDELTEEEAEFVSGYRENKPADWHDEQELFSWNGNEGSGGIDSPEVAAAKRAARSEQTEHFRRLNDLFRSKEGSIRQQRLVEKYEQKLADENQWATYMGLRDGFTPQESRCVDLALGAGGRDGLPENARQAFLALPTESQKKVAPLLKMNSWRRDTTLVGDAVRGMARVLGQTVEDTFTGAASYVHRAIVDGKDYQDAVERRALLRQANEGRMKEWGLAGEAVVGAFSTIPYMAIASIPYAGTAAMMLSAGEQFEQEAALAGADVSDWGMQRAKAVMSLAYALTEKLQAGHVFGEITDFERRQLYATAFHALNGRVALKLGAAVLEGGVHESIEEGIQNGIQEAYVAMGLDGDALRAFTRGFVEDAAGTFGTMLLTAGFGEAAHTAQYRNRPFTSADEIVQWHGRLKAAAAAVGGESSGAEGLAELGRGIGFISRTWRRAAESQSAAVRQGVLERFGLSRDQAAQWDALLMDIERGIGGDKASLQAFYGTEKALTREEIRARGGGMAETVAEDGTRTLTVSSPFGGASLTLEIVPELALDVNDPALSESIVNTLNGHDVKAADGGAWTVAKWESLDPGARADIAGAAGLSRKGSVDLVSSDGARVDGRYLAALEGRMTIAEGTGDVLGLTAFHEQGHAVARILRDAAAGGNEQAASLLEGLRRRFGDALDPEREAFNEEAFGDALRDWVARRLDVAEEDAGLFQRFLDWVRSLFGAAESAARTRSLADEFFDEATQGRWEEAFSRDDAETAERETAEIPRSTQENALGTGGNLQEAGENGALAPNAQSGAEGAEAPVADPAAEKARRQLADYEERLAQLPETATKKRRELERKIERSRRRLEPDGTARASVTAAEDAAYMDAVKRGDMETAQRMVREAAAKAFPDTKVVDEDGLPKVVYHDSGERHNILSRDYARKSMDIEAVFFHENRDEYHEYGPVEHAVFLNVRNPANFAQAMEGFKPGSAFDAGVRQREKLQAKGYDGFWFSSEEMGGPDLAELGVFDSEQIKSADPVTYDDAGNVIPLSQRFNQEREDIRYSITAARDGTVSAAEAMERDGATREEIWKRLGAYRGVDGRWRMEANDLRWSRNGRKALADLLSGKRKGALALGDVVSSGVVKSDPNLAALRVIVLPKKDRKSAGGWFDGRRIAISPDYLGLEDSAKELLDTLSHEVQHYLQWRDGLVNGGSEETAARMREDLAGITAPFADALSAVNQEIDGYYRRWDLAGIRTKADEKMRRALDEIGRRSAAGEIGGDEAETLRSLAYEMADAEYRRRLDALDRDGAFRALEERRRELERRVRPMRLTDHGVYLSLAGEVEARMVERRRNMTQAQRRAEPPWVTQERMGMPEAAQVVHSRGTVGLNETGFRGLGDTRYSVTGLFTGTAADYAQRVPVLDKNGNVTGYRIENGPSLKHIGTGEGHQVYGWGLYGSTVRGVAEGYKWNNLKGGILLDGVRMSTFGNTPFAFVANQGIGATSLDNVRERLVAWLNAVTTTRGKAQAEKALEFFDENRSRMQVITGNIYEQTFFTNRADGEDTERHLLKWYEPVSEEQLEWVQRQYRSEFPQYRVDIRKRLSDFKERLGSEPVGANLYEILSGLIDGPKSASEFLARAGIDGIKYPVDSYGGKTVKDGDVAGWNYVSFRDDNIRVDHKWVDGVQRYSVTGTSLSTMDAAVAFAARDAILGRRRTDEEYGKLIAGLGLERMYTPEELRRAGDAAAAMELMKGEGAAGTDAWRSMMRTPSLRSLAANAKARRLMDDAIEAAYRYGERAGAKAADRATKAERQLQREADALKAEMRVQRERFEAETARREAEARNAAERDALRESMEAAHREAMADLRARYDEKIRHLREAEASRRRAESFFRRALSRQMRTAQGVDLQELDSLLGVPAAELAVRLDEALFSGARAPGQIRETADGEGEGGGAGAESASGGAGEGAESAEAPDDQRPNYRTDMEVLASRVEAAVLADKLDALRRRFEEIRDKELGDAATRAERARRRAEREAREAEEASPAGDSDLPAPDDAGGDGADAEADADEGEGIDSEGHDAVPEIVAQLLAAMRGESLGLSTSADFALALQAYVEMQIADETGKEMDAVMEDPVAVLRYRKTATAFLRQVADALLDPADDASAKWAERRIADIPDDATRKQIFHATADVLGYIQRHGLQQSRRRMVRDIDRYLKRVAVQGRELDPLAPDVSRKVTALVEQEARWLRRVLKLSNGAVRREQEELRDRIEKRRAAGAEDESDVEIDRALRRLAILDQFGGMRYWMPAEIAAARSWIEGHFDGEAQELAERVLERRARCDAIAKGLQDGAADVLAAHGGTDADEATRGGRIMDAIASGSAMQRLAYLTGDSPKARAAVQEVVRLLYESESRRRVLERRFRDEQTRAVEQAARAGGTTMDALVRELDEKAPDELSRALAAHDADGSVTQARSMTWGQVLYLLACLQQTASYADNIAAHGREGQERAILDAIADRPQLLSLLDNLRGVLERRRAMLSEASERTTGLPVKSPDPFYFPARMMQTPREGLDIKVKTWTPWNALFSPRVRNNLDFDTSRSILEVFEESSREAAKSISGAENGLDLRSILGRAETQRAFIRARGRFYNTKLLEQVTDSLNGGFQTPGNDILSLLRPLGEFTTYANLSWNVVTMLKQMASVPAWTAVMDGGYRELVSCMASPDRESVRDFIDSEGFRSRYGTDAAGIGAFRDMVRDAFRDPATPWWKRFHAAGMTLVQFGDFVPSLIVGPGVYKARKAALLRQNPGMSEEAAKERALQDAWSLVEQCQQSDLQMNLPDILRRQGVVAKSVMKFANSPLMQVAHEANAFRMWRDARDRGDGEGAAKWRARFANQVICNHVLMPLAMVAMQRVVAMALGDEPPDDDEFWGQILLECIVGPFSRVFLLGQVFSGSVAWGLAKTGLKPKTYATQDSMGAPVQMLGYMMDDAGRLGADLTELDFQSFRDDALRMLGRTTRPVKYATRAAQNYSGYDPAKERARRRRERAKGN